MKIVIDEKTKKWAKRAAIFGAVLALVCHLLPPDYRAVCDVVATICRGGL